jgi:hypothetical protein
VSAEDPEEGQAPPDPDGVETVLRRTLDRLWPMVRRRHLFPELPSPRLESCASRAAMEIREKQITLNLDYAAEMSRVLPAETVLIALLDHAVSHYTCCPWDLTTHLRLYARAKEIMGNADLARRATDLFMDVVADTHAVKERQSPLPLLYRHAPRDVADDLLCSLFENIWGVDLGAKEHREEVKRLSSIPYLDKRRWIPSLTRFIRAIRPFLEEAQPEMAQDERRMGGHGFRQYRPEEIEKALREFAKGVDSPQKFVEIFEDIQNDLRASGECDLEGMGYGKGCPVDANWLYYMKLAENYALPIKKIPMRDSGNLHPHSHRPWEIGQPVREVDPWSSFGKYLPGITQIWERRQGEIFGKKEKTPDCLIVIDSSGSMVDPRARLSHAVLGAGCAADAYLRNDAHVAVYNFSDAPAGGREYLPFTRSRPLAYRVLCRYFGGGTALDLREITSLVRDIEADIFLITDMQITNLDQTIARLSALSNRVTAVHVGKKPGALRFIKAAKRTANISVFGVEQPADIPRIVLGSVRSYLADGKRKQRITEEPVYWSWTKHPPKAG